MFNSLNNLRPGLMFEEKDRSGCFNQPFIVNCQFAKRITASMAVFQKKKKVHAFINSKYHFKSWQLKTTTAETGKC